MDLPDRNDLFAVGRQYIKGAPNTRINPVVVDVPGSDLNLVVGSGALQGEAIVAAWAKCVRGLFVGTAKGDQLDRVVYDRFGITRKPANAATADLTLSRVSFAAGGGTVPAGTRIQSASGSIFALQTDVVFGATDLVQTGEGVAQLVGPTQNIPAGSLTAFIDQPFDPIITVTNTGPAAGGTDAENDPSFRGRAYQFFQVLRRGILGAIQYGATTVPGVSVSTAFEIVNPGNALPAGAVQLVIADDNGNASTAMIQAVIDVMLVYRAAGIPVFVEGGTVQFVQGIYKLAFVSQIDTVAASEQVRAAAVAIAQFKRPGEALLESDWKAAARAVPGVIVRADSLVAPVGDVVPPTNEILLRVRPQDVSFV